MNGASVEFFLLFLLLFNFLNFALTLLKSGVMSTSPPPGSLVKSTKLMHFWDCVSQTIFDCILAILRTVSSE